MLNNWRQELRDTPPCAISTTTESLDGATPVIIPSILPAKDIWLADATLELDGAVPVNLSSSPWPTAPLHRPRNSSLVRPADVEMSFSKAVARVRNAKSSHEKASSQLFQLFEYLRFVSLECAQDGRSEPHALQCASFGYLDEEPMDR